MQSVTRAVEREQLGAASRRRPRRAACSARAARRRCVVHTDQWPSSPPRKRTVTGAPSRIDGERRDQVEHDVVVVAGVERDAVLGAGVDDAAHHVERAVAIERRDLDRDDVVDRGEARARTTPAARARRPPAADRSRPAGSPRRPPRNASISSSSLAPFMRGEAEQAGVVAEAAREPRLGTRLLGARRKRRRPCTSGRLASMSRAVSTASSQHRLVQADLADRELRRVHADREPAGAGVEVVAGQRALAPLVEPALGGRAPADAPGSRVPSATQLRRNVAGSTVGFCATALSASAEFGAGDGDESPAAASLPASRRAEAHAREGALRS